MHHNWAPTGGKWASQPLESGGEPDPLGRPRRQSLQRRLDDLDIVAAVLPHCELHERVGVARGQRGPAHSRPQVPAHLRDLRRLRGGQQRPRVERRRGAGVPAVQSVDDFLHVSHHRLSEPVGPRLQETLSEDLAKPRHLRAHGHQRDVVLVQHHRQPLAGEPLRGRRQQNHQLRVARGQLLLMAVPSQHATAPAEHQQLRTRLGGLLNGEPLLDRHGSGADHGQRLGGRHLTLPGHVQYAEDTSGVGVVDRDGGTTPRLHRPAEVLGGEDLHGRVEGQRCAGSIRARGALRPFRPRNEPHLLGTRAQLLVPLDPQQATLGITHGDHVPAGLYGLGEQ
jgi:hypothetical protein